MRVRDVMLTRVPTVGPDVTIRSVAILFCEYGTDAVVVVDERGRPAGVVSESVLAAALDAITREDDRRHEVPPPQAGPLARTWCLEPRTPSNPPSGQSAHLGGRRSPSEQGRPLPAPKAEPESATRTVELALPVEDDEQDGPPPIHREDDVLVPPSTPL